MGPWQVTHTSPSVGFPIWNAGSGRAYLRGRLKSITGIGHTALSGTFISQQNWWLLQWWSRLHYRRWWRGRLQLTFRLPYILSFNPHISSGGKCFVHKCKCFICSSMRQMFCCTDENMEARRGEEASPKVTQLAILGLSSGTSDPVVLLALLQAASRTV